MLVPEACQNPCWQTQVLLLWCWPGSLLQMNGRWLTYRDCGAHWQLHYCCNEPGTDWTSKTQYQKVCQDHGSGGASLAFGHQDKIKQRGMHHFPLPTHLYQIDHPLIQVWGPETHLHPNGPQRKTLHYAVSLDQIPICHNDTHPIPWGHQCTHVHNARHLTWHLVHNHPGIWVTQAGCTGKLWDVYTDILQGWWTCGCCLVERQRNLSDTWMQMVAWVKTGMPYQVMLT